MSKIINFFKNKTVIITGIILLTTVVIYVGIYFLLMASFKINGGSKVYINYNEDYIDKGATLKILGNDFSEKINTNSNVVVNKLGNYEVVYSVNLYIYNLKKKRTVNIVDDIKPVVTLEGETSQVMCPNKEYEEEGYSAFDEFDGDLTDKVVITKTDEGYEYDVVDNAGNKDKALRSILYIDTEAPTFKLKGSETTYIRKGNEYKDPGYVVSDNCDVDITVDVDSNVDYNTDGTYKVTYVARDSSGNETTGERNVVVYTDNRIGIVYLTFDDGPSSSGSTALILDVLKEEGVKATFFVTGKGPDDLIKREYDEGHVVALHTNTHDYYTMYKTVDAYYADLNAVRDRVYNITGEYSNIIRFPGGSNNTVSKTASGYVIMNTLTQKVVEDGYYYFDWNVSSGDAGGCTTSSCVYSNVVNGLSKSRINIVLMHDIKYFTANAIRDIIRYCKNNGFEFDVITENTQPVRFK